jgi:hypothetical protein
MGYVGHADILRLFIDRLQVMNQISQINERTNDGWTPLMRATVRGIIMFVIYVIDLTLAVTCLTPPVTLPPS